MLHISITFLWRLFALINIYIMSANPMSLLTDMIYLDVSQPPAVNQQQMGGRKQRKAPIKSQQNQQIFEQFC